MTPADIRKKFIAAGFGLYVVINREGKFYRSKGMNGYGETWIDDVMKCKVYTRVAQARGVVTFFSNKWPQFGVPVIVKIGVGPVEVLDEKERVAKVVERKKREEAEYERLRRERELEHARAAAKSAAEKIKELTRGKK